MYTKFIKRMLDVICSLLMILIIGWLFLILFILVRIKLGKPVIFKQPRPGKKGADGNEKIFTLYKFRTMTNEKDENGNLLSDAERLTKFGSWMRACSLDELPEVINILKGDMSFIGPRPQLVRDMVFMSDDQRRRHIVRPGLSGLAQINGRNSISWDKKLNIDLEYIENVSFLGDLKIVFGTFFKVFKQEGITSEGQATIDDYGDVLLKSGHISQEEYMSKQNEAKRILEKAGF